MQKILTFIGVGAIVMLLLPASASGSEKSDQKLAERAVLQQSDVPDVFEEVPVSGDDEGGETDVCSGAIGAAGDAALAAPHANSAFRLGGSQGYAVISSEVAVLGKVAEAKSALNAFQDEEPAEACVQSVFEEFLAQQGVTTEVTAGSFAPELDDKGNKKVIRGGDEFAGFSVNARRFVEGGQPQFFEAIVVVGRVGRGTLRLTFVSSGTVPNDDVQSMTQDVVRRLKPARRA